jgi:ATP phosphoribosyltransferase
VTTPLPVPIPLPGPDRARAVPLGLPGPAAGQATLAVQRRGRLTEPTLALLRAAGLAFEAHGERLLAACHNFPLTLLRGRDDDIPPYVAGGTVDLGIVGQDLVREHEAGDALQELLPLGFGHCALVLAVPRAGPVERVEQLAGARVASAYPRAARRFFAAAGVPVEVVALSGAVEVAPLLGFAAGIVDLTVTGTGLLLHDLRPVCTLFESQAVLVGRPAALADPAARPVLDRLLLRLKAVLDARRYKYVMLNAPRTALPAIRGIVPGLKSPTVVPLADPDWVAVHAAVPEDAFWEAVERLRAAGATEILVAPLEKLLL